MTRIAQKQHLANFKQAKPVRSKAHLSFIHALPCIVTGISGEGIHAHHIINGRYSAGRKSGDDMTVPLYFKMHDPQWKGSVHDMGEILFEKQHGLDLKSIAAFLWANTGDVQCCAEYIRERKWA